MKGISYKLLMIFCWGCVRGGGLEASFVQVLSPRSINSCVRKRRLSKAQTVYVRSPDAMQCMSRKL